jgi:hypothetical protein
LYHVLVLDFLYILYFIRFSNCIIYFEIFDIFLLFKDILPLVLHESMHLIKQLRNAGWKISKIELDRHNATQALCGRVITRRYSYYHLSYVITLSPTYYQVILLPKEPKYMSSHFIWKTLQQITIPKSLVSWI